MLAFSIHYEVPITFALHVYPSRPTCVNANINFRLSEDGISLTGSIFVFPIEVEHLPTRVFYPHEVFLTSNDRATFSITSVKGKCFIMRPADFCLGMSPLYIPCNSSLIVTFL